MPRLRALFYLSIPFREAGLRKATAQRANLNSREAHR